MHKSIHKWCTVLLRSIILFAVSLMVRNVSEVKQLLPVLAKMIYDVSEDVEMFSEVKQLQGGKVESIEKEVIKKNSKMTMKTLNCIISKIPGKCKILSPVSFQSQRWSQESPVAALTLLVPTPLPLRHVHLILQVHWSRKIKTKPVIIKRQLTENKIQIGLWNLM